MGKKVREYKSGDFIFAKVKGYPAWPARVQKLNGKRYFVYFYGTGETANLPPNMIFDYAENKDKFLTKTVKRRDFNDGVKQIEHDFANNVPLEDVIGVPIEAPADVTGDETLNDTANDTVDETMDTTADDGADESTANVTAQNETAVDDSDDTGALVIDEGNKKGKKAKAEPKPKETPKAKEPKTPRGKNKREEELKEEDGDTQKKEEEIVSRSGRKIRPKRYIDEHTEENTTLPSPAPKKRRGASPADKDGKDKSLEKNTKHYNTVSQSELEDLKEPYKPDDAEKENILITYLPTGQYIGIKLFQSRPASFKNENSRLQWDKQAASNAVTLKLQLERGQIKPESVLAQLVMDLNLTDEEKTTLDKERETEEKKSRVQFLKTEMKLIELDAKIKTCLCLEKADTELCLKLLDELMELEVKPLMLLKHPTCVETVKRMRAYVGNTPSWDLSESAALHFSKQALRIRKLADTLYKNMKELFTTPDGLSFWEYFSERVTQFKKVTAKLSADELLEMVHEPLEMSVPTSHNMKSAIDAANDGEKEKATEADKEEDSSPKKKTPVKPKKQANSTPSKATKRQSSRKQQEEKEKEKDKETEKEIEKEKQDEQTDAPMETDAVNSEETANDTDIKKQANSTPSKATKRQSSRKQQEEKEKEKDKEIEKEKQNEQNDAPMETDAVNSEDTANDTEAEPKTNNEQTKEADKEPEQNDKEKEKDSNTNDKDNENSEQPSSEPKEDAEKESESNKEEKEKDSKGKDKEKDTKDKNKNGKDKETKSKDVKEAKDNGKDSKESKDKDSKEKEAEKESKDDKDEPRAKRSRESKKTEAPPPRSPTKRKSKF